MLKYTFFCKIPWKNPKESALREFIFEKATVWFFIRRTLLIFVGKFSIVMARRILALLLSVALLSAGWLGVSGLALPVAFVPLLWMSAEEEATRRGWWRMFRWALLLFVLWNVATVWWIWNATPVGPIAATIVSSALNLMVFMFYHTLSKKAPKALAYTALVAAWIATEYWYTVGDVSWPWLVLGNGFSHDVWAVQWYEWTGVWGGSLWVWVCNILVFEALHARTVRRIVSAAVALLLPPMVSLGLWWSYGEPTEGSVEVSILQPNVDCYDKFHGDTQWQLDNIFDLLQEVPATTDFILLPETALPGYYNEPTLSEYYPPRTEAAIWQRLRDTLCQRYPQAMLVTGTNTRRFYTAGNVTPTARSFGRGLQGDIFNAAVGVDTTARTQIHHKGRLVVGVEKTPLWIFDVLDFLVIDLGGVVGQIGQGVQGTVFEHRGVRMGPAICYEGIYGEFFGDFVRRGADWMAILSNDGWWGDTPGYRHLFSISRLRAIEHRRAIARSANTGMSGFISARGDVSATLGWEERGVLTERVALHTRQTLYTRYGDFLARIACYVTLLCALYYIAYRAKRRNYLVQ